MGDPALGALSDDLFWVALGTYALSMVLLFASLAYRGKRIGIAGVVVAWGGLLVQATSVVMRAVAAGRVPWGNMFEYSNMIALLLVAGYLIVLDARMRLRQLGGFVIGFATLALGSAWFTYVPASPLQPALDSNWLKIHVMAAIIGSTLFTISFVLTLLSLFKGRSERRAGARFAGSTVGAAYAGPRTAVGVEEGAPTDLQTEEPAPARAPGVMSRLPSADRLDQLSFRTIQLAFPIWTFAVIAGAIWAHEAWSRYWAWDPKETWAFITWVGYAIYLHARSTAGWRGKRAAVISIVAYGTYLFNYFLVNTVFKGLHSYFKG